MNVKKAGLVTAGALTALVAASPLAWAIGPSAEAPSNCSFASEGGTDASSESSITENNLINPVVQTPTGGNNAGVFGKCSTFNQHNGEGDFENNAPLPNPPGLPPLPELPPLPSDGLPHLPGLPELPAPN